MKVVVAKATFCPKHNYKYILTLSWRRPLSYRIKSIDLLFKSMDCFLYDNSLRHERVKIINLFGYCNSVSTALIITQCFFFFNTSLKINYQVLIFCLLQLFLDYLTLSTIQNFYFPPLQSQIYLLLIFNNNFL